MVFTINSYWFGIYIQLFWCFNLELLPQTLGKWNNEKYYALKNSTCLELKMTICLWHIYIWTTKDINAHYKKRIFFFLIFFPCLHRLSRFSSCCLDVPKEVSREGHLLVKQSHWRSLHQLASCKYPLAIQMIQSSFHEFRLPINQANRKYISEKLEFDQI